MTTTIEYDHRWECDIIYTWLDAYQAIAMLHILLINNGMLMLNVVLSNDNNTW